MTEAETPTLDATAAQADASQPVQGTTRPAALQSGRRAHSTTPQHAANASDMSDALVRQDEGFAPAAGHTRNLHGAHPSAIAILPMFTLYMEAATQEHFLIAGFDAGGRLRGFQDWHGDAHQVRQIMPPVLTMLAHDHVDQIIIAHNHPNGGAEPTEQDRITTRTIANLATLSGKHLGDHLLYHARGWLSFRALGMLA